MHQYASPITFDKVAVPVININICCELRDGTD